MRAKSIWFTGLVTVTVSLVTGCYGERHLVGTNSDPGGNASAGGKGGSAGSTTAVGGSGGRGGSGGSGVATGGGASAASGSGAAVSTGGAAGAVAVRSLPSGARNAVTAVSRLLWQSAPDASLLEMADSGALSTTEDLRQLSFRMMLDARAQTGVGDFYRWWLDLDQVASLAAGGQTKDATLFPQFNAALASSMASETQTFGTYVTLDGDGLLATLLSAPFTFVNQALAEVYKLDGITGPALRRVALDPSERVGLLTQPGLLALNSHAAVTSPVLRGYFWYRKLLCRPPLEEPPGIPPLDFMTQPLTMRQRLVQHDSMPFCSGCHSLLDPIGLALEHFDPIGQFRATDQGLPIDTAGQYANEAGGEEYFADVPQLAGDLSSVFSRACMERQWMEYAVGRSLTPQDQPALVEVDASFEASGNLRDLIAALTTTDLFLTHTPVCTPGADQTCNDAPTLSSPLGHCTEGQRCACTVPSVLNPDTGRCK